MLKVKIFGSPYKCMTGTELRRLREEAGITSQQELADKMYESGWHQSKVSGYERAKSFCLHPNEMQALLNILGAVSL